MKRARVLLALLEFFSVFVAVYTDTFDAGVREKRRWLINCGVKIWPVWKYATASSTCHDAVPDMPVAGCVIIESQRAVNRCAGRLHGTGCTVHAGRTRGRDPGAGLRRVQDANWCWFIECSCGVRVSDGRELLMLQGARVTWRSCHSLSNTSTNCRTTCIRAPRGPQSLADCSNNKPAAYQSIRMGVFAIFLRILTNSPP